MNIHLTSYGKGIPLVFFHGWGFDSQIWLPLVAQLEKSYQLILVDLPGFGLSTMMGWFEFKKRILAVLPEQFVLVGWSLGGLYATRLAIEEPKHIKSLVNITSSPRFIADSLWPGVPKEVFANFYTNLSLDINSTLREFVNLQCGESYQISGRPPSPAGLETGLNVLDSWDLRGGLKHLKHPTCFMFGRLDPITPVKTMKAMELIYPDFKYVLFNKAAHMPFLSHKNEFIDELSGFIQ